MSKRFNPKKISSDLAIPFEDFEKTIEELKKIGLIFTFAKSSKEFGSKKYPYRLVGKPSVSPDDLSAVTFGPFPVKRKVYERAREELKNIDTFNVYLGFLRLNFEKTGGLVEGYKFQASEETTHSFLSTIDFWDTLNPVIYDDFVWILPNERCKEIVEDITGKKYKNDDFSWWNTKLDIGEDFNPSTLEDYPEQYGLIPNDLIDKWGRYLPTIAWQTAMLLYQKITRNNNMDLAYENITSLLSEIKDGIAIIEGNIKTDSITVDRELLAKELCDLNSLTYPIDETTMLEFLQQIGFIITLQEKGKVSYSLTKTLPSPKQVLKIPKKWEDKMDKFVSSGTILFAYLSTDEIIGT